MLNSLFLLAFFYLFHNSIAVIFHLNDSEHARMPPLHELDDYENCLRNSHTYCTALFDLQGEPDREIYTLIREYSKHSVRHFNYSQVERGICVEETCRGYLKKSGLDMNQNLETILEGCFNETMKQKYGLESKLQLKFCDGPKTKEIPFDVSDIIMIIILSLICGCVIIGSVYDLWQRKGQKQTESLSKGNRFWLSFSIVKNFEILVRVDKGDERLTELKGFHGIRALFEYIVVYSHCYFIIGKYTQNPHEVEKMFDLSWFRIIFSYSGIVQVFFYMSGFLMTYVLQITEEKIQITWQHVPKIIFARWWRLTPPFAIVVGIMCTLFRHFGTGPMWKSHVIEGVSSHCRKYFWTHIFYFNNFMAHNICSLESWHVAVDMQLFILGIIMYLYIRNKSWKYKAWTIGIMMLIGILSPIAHVWWLDLDGVLTLKPEFIRTLYDDTFQRYHILFYNNQTCFFMGMANAYLIYYLKQKKMENPNFTLFKIASWLSIPLLLVLYYYSGTNYNDNERASLSWRLAYAGLHRLLIGIILTIWLLGVTMKFLGNSVWEWQGWVIPSKLSYCMYLIHDNILHYISAAKQKLTIVSKTYVFYTFPKVLFLSQAMALLLYLFVEAPAKELIKIVMQDKKGKKEA